jgi:uncharacterized protein
VRVVPGARTPGVVGRLGEAWKIRVSQPAERGAANDALVRLLADTLAVPTRGISLVSGHTGREKILEIAGIGPSDAERRLASAERKDSRR